jgi:hypothetical protein
MTRDPTNQQPGRELGLSPFTVLLTAAFLFAVAEAAVESDLSKALG